MRNGWNFHADISVPLENYGKHFIGETCIGADEIEGGQFVDAMLQILSAVYGSLLEVVEFVDCCRDYAGMPALNIPKETADELFADFKRLLQIKGR